MQVTANAVAIVTGANKGVGYHIAAQLVASGLFGTVVLACRDPTRGTRAAAEVGGEYLPLNVGDPSSADALAQAILEKYGRCDLLVNNAAIAFKAADPTPFNEQTKPTLDVNYRGTVQVTEALLPLLDKQPRARIVNVASMAGKLRQLAPNLQRQFASPSLTLAQLHALVESFEADVSSGTHARNGWGRSNYGFSKLAVIAATKVWAREHPSISVNAMCPGYCDTDMSSHRGPRPPAEGAKIAVLLATMEQPPSGEFYENMRLSEW